MQYAAKWAAENGMALDQELTMRDEGLSAYHQHHIKSGALGLFLAAVADGRIVPGSVLVVEGLDRLSRAEPIQAQAQLTQIVTAGITVVTASDGKAYTREGLRTQPMDLVYSLLVMIRAHEESDVKSRRVKAAQRRHAEDWIAGTTRKPLRAGHDPAYLSWDGQRWQIDEQRASAVLRIIELYRAGHGAHKIVTRLTGPEVTPTSGKLSASHVYKMIRSRALYGDRELTIDGEAYVLHDYYPPLMTRDAWDALQASADDRGRRRVKGDMPHIITGWGMTRCGYCGLPMSGQHLSNRRRPGALLVDGHRRLLCSGNSRQTPCPRPGSCSVAPVERAILRYCSDQILLDHLLASRDDGTAEIRTQLAALRGRLGELKRQVERMAAVLAEDDGPTPIAVLRRIREAETAQADITTQIERMERELATSMSGSQTHDQASAWSDLAAAAVDRHDYDARVRVRQMIAQTFERLVIYHHGTDGQSARAIDIVLQAKGGAPRWLQIDRRSGETIPAEGGVETSVAALASILR